MSTTLTTIAVEPSVKAALAARGVAGQSFNDVLKEILNVKQEPQTRKQKNVEASELEPSASTPTIPRDDQYDTGAR